MHVMVAPRCTPESAVGRGAVRVQGCVVSVRCACKQLHSHATHRLWMVQVGTQWERPKMVMNAVHEHCAVKLMPLWVA